MAQKKINEEIKDLESLQSLIQTYEEIAATRMQRSKDSVFKSREFLTGIDEVLQKVRYFYDKTHTPSEKEKDKRKKITRRNGKTITVLLSANTGLYGSIIRDTYEAFSEYVKENKTDIAVVGRSGKQMVENFFPELKFKYFEVSDGAVKSEHLKDLVSHIVAYESAIVFHGKYESLLRQIPTKTYITGDSPQSKVVPKEDIHFIFEPSIDQLMAFFESEILASLFEQSLFESGLSKYASRMTNLDRAVVNIGAQLKLTRFLNQRAQHQQVNKKQLGLLSSMSLWQGGY